MAQKHLIILVHGIRDPGFWQNTLKDLFESRQDVVVKTIRTEVIDLFRFIAPTTIYRQKFIDKVHTDLRQLIFDPAYAQHRKTVIAHSFGTHIVSEILHEDPTISLDKLIMCGAIVSNKFRWDRVRRINFPSGGDPILNEYSPKDIWPILANRFAFGYGNCGAKGCGSAVVSDRKHYVPHSEYLTEKFAKKFWEPYIFEDLIEQGPAPTASEAKEPWYFLFTRIPVNWMGVAVASVMGALVAQTIYSITYVGGVRASLKAVEFKSKVDGKPQIAFVAVSKNEQEAGTKQDNMYVRQAKTEHTIKYFSFKAASVTKANAMVLEIDNRPSYSTCANEEALSIEGNTAARYDNSTENKTTFTISMLPKSRWSNIWDGNWTGTQILEVYYNPDHSHEDELLTDFLKVSYGKGISNVSIDAEFYDGDCQSPTEVATRIHRKEPLEKETSMLTSLFNAFAGNLVQKVEGDYQKTIIDRFESGSRSQRERSIQQLKYHPKHNRAVTSVLLNELENLDQEQIVQFLAALPDTILDLREDVSDNDLYRVFALSWDHRSKVRGAARKFLRHKDIASRNLGIKLSTHWKQIRDGMNPHEKVSDTYRKEYLAHVSLRDIFYNAAINEFSNAREISGFSNTPLDKALANSIKTFEAAEWLVTESPPTEKAAMSKVLFGKAHVMMRDLIVRRATDGLYSALTNEEIVDRILNKRKLDSKIPTDADVKVVQDAFDDFLNIAAATDAYYPWKRHIQQAKSCAANPKIIDYNCLVDS